MKRGTRRAVARTKWATRRPRPPPMTTPLQQRFLAYLQAYETKNLPAVAALLADGVCLRDWNLSVQGKAAVLAETQKNFESSGAMKIVPLVLYEGPRAVAGELQILIEGGIDLRVVDALAFDAEGLICAIRAYKGRPDHG